LASERANRASDSTPGRRASVFTRHLPLVLWAAATTSSVGPWGFAAPAARHGHPRRSAFI